MLVTGHLFTGCKTNLETYHGSNLFSIIDSLIDGSWCRFTYHRFNMVSWECPISLDHVVIIF